MLVSTHALAAPYPRDEHSHKVVANSALLLPQVLTVISPNTLTIDGSLTATVITTAVDGGRLLTFGIINLTGSAVIQPNGLLASKQEQ